MSGAFGEMFDHLPLLKGFETAIPGFNRRQGINRAPFKNMPAHGLVYPDVIRAHAAIKIKIAALELLIAVVGRNGLCNMHVGKLLRG